MCLSPCWKWEKGIFLFQWEAPYNVNPGSSFFLFCNASAWFKLWLPTHPLQRGLSGINTLLATKERGCLPHTVAPLFEGSWLISIFGPLLFSFFFLSFKFPFLYFEFTNRVSPGSPRTLPWILIKAEPQAGGGTSHSTSDIVVWPEVCCVISRSCKY